MKTLFIILISLLVLSNLSGCAPEYCNPDSLNYNLPACQQYQQQWREAWRQVNENRQRQLDRQYYYDSQYPKLGTPIYRNQRSTTYWQERRAKQQYWNNWSY